MDEKKICIACNRRATIYLVTLGDFTLPLCSQHNKVREKAIIEMDLHHEQREAKIRKEYEGKNAVVRIAKKLCILYARGRGRPDWKLYKSDARILSKAQKGEGKIGKKRLKRG